MRKSTRRSPQRSRQIVTEAQLRKIIYAELVDQYIINEGLWDDVKSGAKKLSAYVTKHLKDAAAKWAKAIAEKLPDLQSIPEEVQQVFDIIKSAVKESGEKLPSDEGVVAARELGKISKEDALAAVQRDFEGPVHEKAKQAQVKGEGKYIPELYSALCETKYLSPALRPRAQLHEAVGVVTALGIGLAVMGGLSMLLEGLSWIAKKLGAEETAALLHKAHKVIHHIEEKSLEFALPTPVTYLIYKGLWKVGRKMTKGDKPLSSEEFSKSDDGKTAAKKIRSGAYKILLFALAINGLFGVLHAGASMLGFVEGTATSIKGVELARGAKDIARIILPAAAAAEA